MMLSAACAVRRHAGHDVWPHGADQPYVVADNLVLPPFLKGLVDAEGKAEINGAREILFGPIEPMQCSQLLGAQDAERFEDLRTDLVLTAISARGGREHRSLPLAAIQLD